MAVSAPNGYNSDISSNIQPVGSRTFLGSDSYTVTSAIIFNGTVEDIYECSLTSVKSMTGIVTVQGNTADSSFA